MGVPKMLHGNKSVISRVNFCSGLLTYSNYGRRLQVTFDNKIKISSLFSWIIIE